MKQNLNLIIVVTAVLFLGGCAPVKFYSDAGLTHSSGLKYYTEKPYLLVDREIASGNIVKVTVVYLPDIDNPQYMVVRDGIGSRKAEVRLANGSISSISIASESGIPEVIGSVADLTDKTAEALKDVSSLKGPYPGAASATVTELYEFIMNDNVTSVRKIEIK